MHLSEPLFLISIVVNERLVLVFKLRNRNRIDFGVFVKHGDVCVVDLNLLSFVFFFDFGFQLFLVFIRPNSIAEHGVEDEPVVLVFEVAVMEALHTQVEDGCQALMIFPVKHLFHEPATVVI